jgi:hypothetical protein
MNRTFKSYRQEWIALASAIVPDLKDSSVNPSLGLKLESDFWSASEYLIEGLNSASKKGILTFLKVLQIWSILRFQKSLKNMDFAQSNKLIRSMYTLPIAKFNAGINGIRNLMFIAYYSLPSVWENLGYDGPIVKRNA